MLEKQSFRRRITLEHLSAAMVREHLEPYHDTMNRLVREANGTWNVIAPNFSRVHARTRATNVSNAYFDAALSAFAGKPGLRLVEECERLLVVVDDALVVRFKLLDRVKQTRNYPTRSSLRMDAQEQVEIDGVGKLPRVVLGYTLAGVPATHSGTFIVYPFRRRAMWFYAIDGDEGGTLPLSFDRPTGPTEHEFRLLGEPETLEESEDDSEHG
jgi:hypothetical protein